MSGQTTVLSFGGASVAQVREIMEFQGEDQLDTMVILLGTNDVSRAHVTPEGKWEPLLVCLLNELKENTDLDSWCCGQSRKIRSWACQ